MHSHGFAHRDLKPQLISQSLCIMVFNRRAFILTQNNQTILLEWAPGGSLSVKIGDFGVSKHIPKDSNTLLQTHVGTLRYTAPKIWDDWGGSDGYTKEVDCYGMNN